MAAKTTKKTVAKPKAKTNVSKDPLADLGLEDDTAVAEVTPPAGPAPVIADAVTEATNEEVDVGDIELGFAEFIPNAKRTSGGSKYKFDQLVAPAVWADGPHKGKPKIANFTVKLLPGVDADKLRRSVQSATTQANKQGKAEGKYFVSRSITKDGVFAGMQVFRTDDAPKD